MEVSDEVRLLHFGAVLDTISGYGDLIGSRSYRGVFIHGTERDWTLAWHVIFFRRSWVGKA